MPAPVDLVNVDEDDFTDIRLTDDNATLLNQAIQQLRADIDNEVHVEDEEFHAEVSEDVIKLGAISMKDAQAEEVAMETMRIEAHRADLLHNRERAERVMRYEMQAKESMVPLRNKMTEELRRVNVAIGSAKERRMNEQQTKFRRVEDDLRQAMARLEGELVVTSLDPRDPSHKHHELYDIIQSRRFQVAWLHSPRMLRIRVDWVRALSTKLPEGSYQVMCTLYDRVGGSPLRWSKALDPLSTMKRTLTGATPAAQRFAGTFRDLELSFGQKVNRIFLPCPSQYDARPAMCIVFELILTSIGDARRHQTVGWGVFPLVRSTMDLIQGNFKVPLLRGPVDPSFDKYLLIEQRIASDLDAWLGNVYFHARLMPRSVDYQRSYSLELNWNISQHPETEAEADEDVLSPVRTMQPVPDLSMRSPLPPLDTTVRLSDTSRSSGGNADIDGSSPEEDALTAALLASDNNNNLFSPPQRARTLKPAGIPMLPIATSLPSPSPARAENAGLLRAGALDSAFDTDREAPPVPPVDKSKIPRIAIILRQSDSTGQRAQVDAVEKVSKRNAPRVGTLMSTTKTLLRDLTVPKPGAKSLKWLAVEELPDPNPNEPPSSKFDAQQPSPVARERFAAATRGQAVLGKYAHSVRVDDLNDADAVPKAKLKYIKGALLADLHPSRWRTADFWASLLVLLFAFWLRIYPHYLGQWLLLRTEKIPVLTFAFRACWMDLTYSPQPTVLPDMYMVIFGHVTNIIIFFIFCLLAWLQQRALHRFPWIASQFMLGYGLGTMLDPLLIFIVDACRWNYPSGDAFKLYYFFLVQEGSGGSGVMLQLIIAAFLCFVSFVLLYSYVIHLHHNGRMMDVFRRLYGTEELFFMPRDMELSTRALRWIITQAKHGISGPKRRITTTRYQVVDKSKPHDGKSDETVHLALYNTKLNGEQELYRNFVRLPDGAICALLGDSVEIPGKKAMIKLDQLLSADRKSVV